MFSTRYNGRMWESKCIQKCIQMSLVGGVHTTLPYTTPQEKKLAVYAYSIVYFSLAIYNVKAANDGLISMGSR